MNTLIRILAKVKFFAILIGVAFFMWFLTVRWTRIFKPGWVWILGGVVVAAVGIVIYEIFRRRHEKKMAEGLESGISQAEGDKIDLKGEIKALRDNWSSSVESLKSADAGSGRTALYRLPWFMIIGEPASGKSTLLRKSGLDFPIGDAQVRGMHGTRNCDWWFANEAIFLDTAGRYIIETQEQEWIAFLSLIAKYRQKKPISGVLVAIAANSLLTKNHDELLQDGRRIRNRVDELIDVLGVNFPIFVLVTKVDLISGFREFFSPLDVRYRDQHFDMEAYDKKFAEVTERLYRMRPWLESRVGPRDLGKAFLFPEEFSYVGDPLRTVLDVVFKPNVYQETPVCRGVYFSSGTQVGSPLAKALEDMAKDLHIPADFGFGHTLDEEKEVRTYFIKDLVSHQILNDKDLTWRTGREEVRAKKRRTGWGMMGIGFAALLGLFATSSFVANRSRLTDFEGHLPKSGRPLQVALGTLAAKEEATPPGFGDIGLNYSDEVIPTLEESFRQVTARGCVNPPLADIKGEMDAGVQIRNETPDVASYLTTWGHYRYLKDGIEGRLPAEFDAEKEEPHLEYLMTSLWSRKYADDSNTTEELRTVLRRFGEGDGMEGLPEKDRVDLERRMKEVEDSFAAGMDGWLRKVETFVAERKGTGAKIRRDFDKGIEALIQACRTEKVRPHQSLDRLKSIAGAIRSAASGLQSAGAGQTPIGSIAASEADLVTTLGTVKEVTTEASGLPARATTLLAPFTEKEITSSLPPRHQALLKLDAEIEAAMKPGPDGPTWTARPTDQDLETRRRAVTEEIDAVGREAWNRIEPLVTQLNPTPIYKEVGEGEDKKKERISDWYDTIPLLAQARRADQRKDEYLVNGLIPWLDGEKWRQARPTDSDSDIYSTKQFVEVMLPRLRAQAAFFEVADEEGLVARDIALDAQGRIHAAIRKWVEDADRHWTAQFQTALPSPAKTLAQVRTQLDEMKGVRPSLLMTNGKNVQKALGDVNRLSEDPRGDPVLANSEPDRQALFDRWCVCFELTDLSVYTIYRAVSDLADFSDAIGLVVGPLGTDSEQARKLVAAALKGGGSVLAQASTIPERVLAGAVEGSPRAEFAVRLKGIVQAAWAGLLEKTAEDVNDRWSSVRVTLSSATSPSAFQAAFGPSGPFGAFRKDYLADLFDGTELLPKKEILGKKLVITEGLRTSLKQADALANGLFDATGTIRSDRVVLDLQLGGTSANGLVLEFQPKTGPTETSPRYINGPRVTFPIQWSPLNCQEFRFTVSFPSGEPRTHRWTGDWAVAQAFKDARQEGDRFIWPKTRGTWKNDAGEEYEVALELLPGTTRRLIDFYPGGDVKSPVKALIDSLPAKAVMVEE